MLAIATLLGCGAPEAGPGTPQPVAGGPVVARVGSEQRPATVRPAVSASARKLATRTRNAIPAREPFEVEVPDEATRLAFSLACAGAGPEPACAPFAIEQSDASVAPGTWQPLFEAAADAGWQDREIALPAGTGRVLRFRSLGPGSADAEPLWGSPLLLGRSEATRPNVVLISLDTLGAASLGSFSGRPDVSPHIDALLARSADFRRAYAQYGNTLVSHASLFSALYPRHHGIYPDVIPGPLSSSLVRELAASGYRSVAFTEGAFVSAAFGFSAGFDAYDDGMLGLSAQMAGGAQHTFQRAADWLRDTGGEGPFFLFLHTYEVHAPYLPRDDEALALADRLTPGDTRAFPAPLQTRQLLNHNSGRETLSARDLERLHALHEAEVHTLDAVLGGFLDRLAQQGLAPHTLLVVTADHGDQFGEWGKVGHGDSLHDRVIHVPLAFRWPGVIDPRRIESPVQLIDVMPTVLELVGLPVPDDVDGTSLVPAIRGEDAPERPAYAEQRTARGECVRLGLAEGCRLDRISVHEGRWLLISSLLPPGRRLYDLESDPRASRDVAAQNPQVADQLEERARRYREAAKREPPESRGLVDVETLRRLRELGYVEPPPSDAGHEASPTTDPAQSPSDMLRAR
jgi:arylsulfatase A-like enzyme